jgi:O-antigen/teichoic acid export membrane protein
LPEGGRKRFLGDYLAVGLSLSLQSLRPLVFIPVITNCMGVEAYGVWAQVMVSALLLSPILTLMFMSALTRFLAGSRSDRDISRTYLASVLIVAGMSAVVLFLTGLAPATVSQLVFGDAALTRYVWAGVAFACCSALCAMLVTYFSTVGRQGTYSLYRSAETLGQCALVLLLGTGGDLSLCIYALSAWMLLIGLIALAVIIRRHGWAWPSLAGFPGLWRFAMWMLLTQWLFFGASSASRYVIVAMMGLQGAAVYMVALQIANITGMVAAPNQLVLLPRLSACWNAGQPERARPLIRLAFTVQAVLGFSAVAMMQQLAQPLIMGLTNRGVVPAPALVLCLSGGVFLYGWFQLSEMAFRMTHRFAGLQVIIAGGGLLNITLALLLIPRLGLLGAGLAYAGSMVVLSVPAYLIAYRVFGAGADLARTLKALVLAGLIYLVLAPLHLLAVGNVTHLLLGVFITVVTFVAGFLLLRIYRLDELRTLWTRLRNPRHEPLGAAAPTTGAPSTPPLDGAY